MNDEGLRLLCEAIIKTACEDYLQALKDDDQRMKYEVEGFFNSKWCKRLTKMDTKLLLRSVRIYHEREEKSKTL